MSSCVSDPKLIIFVTLPSRVYWNATAVIGSEVARNVEWDGGSSLADEYGAVNSAANTMYVVYTG